MQYGAWFRRAFESGCVYALASLGLVACASSADGVKGGGTGGSLASAGAGGLAGSGTSGSAASGGASAGAAGVTGAGGAARACPETPTPQRTGGTQVELGFAPTLSGKPFVLGEPNAVPGGQVSPLNLRFYVSELSLLAADGSLLAVDLISPGGNPEPYGVHLVNFEEPESTRLHVLAPPGSYTGAKFTFGLSDACNQGDAGRSAPLSVNSQMVWPHLAGYLFLRYEATWTADIGIAEAAPPPSMIHMGGLVGTLFAPQAAILGALTVPATGTVTRTIQVSFDEIFRAASSSEDVSNSPLPFQTPESIAGERLRRTVPTLNIFKLVEP